MLEQNGAITVVSGLVKNAICDVAEKISLITQSLIYYHY